MMPPAESLLALIKTWLGTPPSARRSLFTRRFHISGEALAVVRECTQDEQTAFAELLLRLDADPVRWSDPILPQDPASSYPRGLRAAPFAGRKVIFLFDPSHNSIRIAVCE